MAPFPFITGAAQCVVVVLEAIESAAKNRQDLQELAESIVATLVVVRDTVIDHGPTSASCFKDICLDFQTYLNDLLSKLNKEDKVHGIRHLLKAKKISEDISAYRQRVQKAKDDFVIRTMTMTRLALSDVRDDVTTGFSTLTSSVAASERNITSIIKNNIEELRTWGARQSENMENLSARLLQASRQRGLYKGVVWDIIPGDIHVIKPATRSLRCYHTGITYKDSYCTVENSNTLKIIREYQSRGNDREGAMDLKRLDQALDFFIKTKHPNFAQIFGVCRSSSLPAIIFHGTTRIPFDHYLHNLHAKRFAQFYSELFQDLQSVSEDFTMESYRIHTGYKSYNVFTTDKEQEQPYVNEHGKVVFGDLLCYTHYVLGPFELSYTLEYGKYRIHHRPIARPSTEPLHNQVGRWMSSSASRKRDLLNRYDAIIFCQAHSGEGMAYTQTFNRHQLQPPEQQAEGHRPPYCNSLYAPGSILTRQQQPFTPRVPSTLVGRICPWSHDVSMNVGQLGEEKDIKLSFDNGSVSVGLSWYDVSRSAAIRIHMCQRDEIVPSWIAQTIKVYSWLRSRGYGDDFGACIIEGVAFTISISPKDGDRYGPCHVCNAKDRYHDALSLSINAPVIDDQTNEIESWPIVSCSRICGTDSLEEEDICTVRVYGCPLMAGCASHLHPMVNLTIPELNAEHGFDPARDGADVCEYFGWPLLEILDSELMNMQQNVC